MLSNDVLLQAKGISKSYSGAMHPFQVLRQRLFGYQPPIANECQVLKSIDIEVKRGETVGIMGRNGAGKTTLLGILGNVIQPTSGEVNRYCKVATLLGLTAGFNANFSGRENAYLFCSIQGLTRKEADSRMRDIESFADIGRYFNMPLHTYSSGMQARLAFACAVHVDADLIIIDETLAVGDANFRMKCYQKIDEMKSNGMTFLLVSHNPNLVANFCTRAILIEKGVKAFDGPTSEAIEAYKELRTEGALDENAQKNKHGIALKFAADTEATLKDIVLTEIELDDESAYQVSATLVAYQDLKSVVVNFSVRNSSGIALCAFHGDKAGFKLAELNSGGCQKLNMYFMKRMLPGRYYITFGIHEIIGDELRSIALLQNVLSFDVLGELSMTGIVNLNMHAHFELDKSE